MIDNKLVSSNAVIAKIIADLDLKESDIKITDIRQWIGEGLEKIGAVQQLEHKVEIIPVIGHQAKLPCDLYQLGQVAFSFQNSSGWLPMRKATSSFGVYHDNFLDKPEMLMQDSALIPLIKNMFNLVDDSEALAKLNEDLNLRQTLSVLLNQYTIGTVNGKFIGTLGNGHIDGTMFSNSLQYMTKPGYIMVNVPSGYVKISYRGIYTDDDSMPMIPNSASYFEALYWYVTMKLMYPKKLKGQISQNDYYDIRNSWNYYRKQAYAEAMMPTVDDLETISNMWTKLYPEINDHSTFFSTTGDQQRIYNQNI